VSSERMATMDRSRVVGQDQEEWAKSYHLDQSVMVGVDEDIERTIFLVFEEFEKTAGPRFKTFLEIWHKTSFGLIFCGREKFRELFEFTEELLGKVKKYAMSIHNKKPNNQLVRFAAIYMLYSLYFKQPCRPMVRIRLVQDEMVDLLATVELARQENHWDVMFAWCKMFTSHAFHYVAHPVQLGLEVALQMEQREAAERGRGPERENYFQSKEYLGLMKKLNKAHTKYVTLKNSLVSPKAPSDTSLHLTDPTFPVSLRKMARSGVRGAGKQAAGGSSGIGDKRRGLKYKFYEGVGEDEAEQEKQKRIKHMEDGEWVPEELKRRRGGARGRGRKRKVGDKIGPDVRTQNGRGEGSSTAGQGGREGQHIKKIKNKPKTFMSDCSDTET